MEEKLTEIDLETMHTLRMRLRFIAFLERRRDHEYLTSEFLRGLLHDLGNGRLRMGDCETVTRVYQERQIPRP